MQLNIIDEKTHKVADNLHYDITNLDNHHIITVDNVLENPHAFIDDVVKKVPMQLNNLNVENEVFPGYQSKLHIQLPEVTYLIGHLIQKCTDFKSIDTSDVKVSYQVNAMNSDREVYRVSIQPHVDPAVYACVLYLNEEGEGGTSFFTHKSTGLTNMENVHTPFKRTQEYWNYKEWVYDFTEKSKEKVDNDTMLIEKVWEEEHHIKMKFNRLVIYPSYIWHSAIMKKGWYTNMPRISLSGFVFADSLKIDVNRS